MTSQGEEEHLLVAIPYLHELLKKHVTRGHNIVADGLAGAANTCPTIIGTAVV